MKPLPKSGRPRAVALSKRANVFYLERCKVIQKDERVVYLTDTGQAIERMFNIPDKNTLFLLLGMGTSITNSAMRKLSESNVVVGFCGSGGAPLVGLTDLTFVLPQDEYRPTQYAQQWFRLWMDDQSRLSLGKQLLLVRLDWCSSTWEKQGVPIPEGIADDIRNRLSECQTSMEILTVEALWAKKLYALMAKAHGISFKREIGEQKTDDAAGLVNSLIDHGNYLAYGYAATTLHGLGIPFSLPILHGKTRRGGLVFDVADLIKDRLVLPLAFEIGCEGQSPREADKLLRARIIQTMEEDRLLSKLFDQIKDLASINPR